MRAHSKIAGHWERMAHRMPAPIAPAMMSSAMMPAGVFCRSAHAMGPGLAMSSRRKITKAAMRPSHVARVRPHIVSHCPAYSSITTQPGSFSTRAAVMDHRPANAAAAARRGSSVAEMWRTIAPISSAIADATVPGAIGAWPVPQPLATMRDTVVIHASLDCADEIAQRSDDHRFVQRGGVADLWKRHYVHVGMQRSHACDCRRQQDVACFTPDQQQRQMHDATEQCPQIRRFAVHQSRDPRVPARAEAAVAIGYVGQRGHRVPGFVCVERQVWQYGS